MDDSSNINHPHWRGRVLRILGWIACLVVLCFVCVALLAQFRQIPWSQVHFRTTGVVAATVCLLGVAAVQLVARWALLHAYGQNLGWRPFLAASFVPPMGKYLPGGVFSVGSAVVLLRSYGVPAAVGLSVTVLLDALAVLAGLIVSTPLLLWHPVHDRFPMAWVACVVVTLVAMIILQPRVFVATLNMVLRRIARQTIDQVPRISGYFLPVLASFAQWLFAGLSLWFMTASIMDVSFRLVPLFIASSALAITIGYLAPFAPGGIGVREGLFLLTLGPVIGPNVAIVAIAIRVIQTLVEVLLAAAGLSLMRAALPIASGGERKQE